MRRIRGTKSYRGSSRGYADAVDLMKGDLINVPTHRPSWGEVQDVWFKGPSTVVVTVTLGNDPTNVAYLTKRRTTNVLVIAGVADDPFKRAMAMAAREGAYQEELANKRRRA